MQVRVLVVTQSLLQTELSDQAVQPPSNMQCGWSEAGMRSEAVQSANSSLEPEQGFPPLDGGGALQ